MKARTIKTLWLPIALIFGLLTAAGLTLMHHRHIPMITAANYTVPAHPLLGQAKTAVVASIPADDTTSAPAGDGYSNSWKAAFTDHSNGSSGTTSASNASGAAADAGSNNAPGIVGGSSNATGSQSPPASKPASDHLAQNGAGEFVYNTYLPQGCELPAGCGGVSGSGSVSRQPAGTSGGTPFLRNSGSDTPGGSNPPPGNTQNSDPPGSGPKNPPAAAPELDPAMLAGAVTLLLGSLAVLLNRRVRATR